MCSSLFAGGRRRPALAAIAVCAVLIAAAPLVAAPPALTPQTLRSWKLADGEAALIKVAGQDVRFAPQGFFASGGTVTLGNRFAPLLVTCDLDQAGPERAQPLAQAADKKFAARFFSDLLVDDGRVFLLEQSTATLRRAGDGGALDAMWLLTGEDGAVITRLWPAGGQSFWLYDQGRQRLLLRRCDQAPDPDRDAPGRESPLTAESLAAHGQRIVAATHEGNDWALLAIDAQDPATAPAVLATLPASSARVLDVGADGTALAYVLDAAGAALLRLPAAGGCERLPLAAPLAFPDDRGRVAQLVAPGRLVLLLAPKADEIALAEIRLP